MANPNFDGIYSTHNIWRGDEEDRCLTDDLDAIEGDIEALETGKADANHSHNGYAEAGHTHEQASIPGLIAALSAKAEATHDHTLAQIVGLVAALAAKADLVDGKVPASQLPSYVDDVIEGHLHNATTFYENIGDDVNETVSVVPENNKVYLDVNTNKSYRWSGSQFVALDEGVALGETSATAYRGDRGKIAYDHSQNGDVHVTAAQKDAWDGKAAGNHVHNHSDVTNPPMLFGVEYLTNEKWNGEPLYTVLLDCGTFADGTIFDSNIACRYVVRYGGRIGWSAVPLIHYTLENAFTSWVEVSNHNGHIRVIMQGGASVGNQPVHIQVWYTKPAN